VRIKSVKQFSKYYNTLNKYGLKFSIDLKEDVYNEPLYNPDSIENKCKL